MLRNSAASAISRGMPMRSLTLTVGSPDWSTAPGKTAVTMGVMIGPGQMALVRIGAGASMDRDRTKDTAAAFDPQ